MLCVDEVVDGGAILETDANAVANRVQMRRRRRPAHHGHDGLASISTITDQMPRKTPAGRRLARP